jgi:hypothetical protein
MVFGDGPRAEVLGVVSLEGLKPVREVSSVVEGDAKGAEALVAEVVILAGLRTCRAADQEEICNRRSAGKQVGWWLMAGACLF